MSKQQVTKKYEKYRGRMCGIVLDPAVIKETDELRGQTSRSRYISSALRAYNKRTAILNQKLVEVEREINEEVEKESEALVQNASSSPSVGPQGKIERSAVMGFSSSSSLYPSSNRQQDDTIHHQDGGGVGGRVIG